MSNSVTISRSLLLASVMILTLLSCKKSNTKNYAGSFFKDQSVEAAIVESKIDSILLNHNLSNQAKDKEIERIKMNYRAKSRIQNIIIIATTAIIILLIVIFLIHNRYLLMKREKNRSIINSAQLQTKLYDQINEDLKSPITIIRGLVDILKQNIIDGNTSKNIINLDVIERQTHNISSLLNDALIFSHSKDKVLSKWVTGDIIPYLQYLINCFADEAEIRGVMLLFLNSHDSIVMGFCKERLKVAINNILSITIKSCMEGEKVLLNVQHIKKENLCVISISQKGNKNNSRKAIPDTFKDSIIEENTEHELYNFNNKITIIRQLVKDMEGAFYFQKNSSNEISYSIELPIKNDNKHDKYIQTEPNELNNKSSEHLIDTMQTSTSKDIDNISKGNYSANL